MRDFKILSKLDYPYNMFAFFVYGETEEEKEKCIREINSVEKGQIALLFYALDILPERNRDLLNLRFMENKTYSACGEILGVTPERVRQLLFSTYHIVKYRNREHLIQRIRRGDTLEDYNNAKRRELREQKKKEDILNKISIKNLDFPARAYNCFIRNKISTIDGVIELIKNDKYWYKKMRNMGLATTKKVYEILVSKGLMDKSILIDFCKEENIVMGE